MSAAEKVPQLHAVFSDAGASDRSRLVLRNNASNELIIAVVGHVGSGTSKVSELLEDLLTAQEVPVIGSTERKNFQVKRFRASDRILDWARQHNRPLPQHKPGDLDWAKMLQDLGDDMRKADHAAVARALIKEIRAWRNGQLADPASEKNFTLPDGQPRAYILDSLRHPAEIQLLRGVYQTAFAVIGVVCDEDRRYHRLFGDGDKRKPTKFSNVGSKDGWAFIDRDRKAQDDHGQRVDDAFHLADFFVDNSPNEKLDNGKPNKDWDVPRQIDRFLRIVTHSKIERPAIAEAAMYAAEGAKLRSACLSRQVGAALVDQAGNLIATGTNEVPRAGGGVYRQIHAEGSDPRDFDDRCAFKENGGCSNTREQRKIEGEVVDVLKRFFEKTIENIQSESSDPRQHQQQANNRLTNILRDEKSTLFNDFLDDNRVELLAKLHKTRLGGLIEFSRAVHAEMDALLSAGRQRISPVGTRMFVTTFPCHSCARHLVAAGVDEVQYLEPYPKSKALALHDDAITMDKNEPNVVRPSQFSSDPSHSKTPKVLFRPFTGVAPRLYARAFLKDRDLKNDATGDICIGDPKWGSPWELGRLSYVQLEEALDEEVHT